MGVKKNFCILPWTHLNFDVSGQTRPCCIYQGRIMKDKTYPFNVEEDNVSDVWNSEDLKNIRERFLSGEKLKECTQCWKEEQGGMDSKRIRELHRFEKLYKEKFNKDVDWEEFISNPKLYYLDIKLGNNCNLKCRICSPWSSSKWIKEQRVYDEHWNMEWSQGYKYNDWADINDEFWKEIFDVIPDVHYIDLSGGEPFLNKKLYKLLDYCVETGHSKHITLHFNTNGTIFPSKFIKEYSSEFQWVDIMFSIDGIEDKFEYQRFPAKWDEVNDNIDSFIKYQKENVSYGVCSTMNILNLYHLDEFVEWVESKGLNYYLNMLEHPNYYNIGLLDDRAKKVITEKLSKLKNNEVQKVLNYMNNNSVDNITMAEFVEQTANKDIYRKNDFKKVYKEFSELIRYDYYYEMKKDLLIKK